MSDDLSLKLQTWLRKHGYPFELRVGRFFRAAGWEVEHNRFYADSDTQQVRELDIYARVSAGDGDRKSAVTVSFAIECKSSPDKPWIVFSAEPDSMVSPLASSMAPGWLGSYSMLVGLPEGNQPLATFGVDRRLAHGMLRAFTDQKGGDPTSPYLAVSSAVQAAHTISHEFETFSLEQGPSVAIIHVVLPLVVLDGKLFEFFLDSHGEDKIVEITRALVVAHGPSSWNRAVLTRIVTADAVPAFAIQAVADAKTLAQNIVPKAHDICEKFRMSPASLRI